MLQFLIDKLPDKSDINVSDDLGSTAAHDAAEFGEHDTLMVLLKNGADISLLNEVSVYTCCSVDMKCIEW